MSDELPDPTLDPRFIAGVEMLRRTGVRQLRIGYSDEDQGEPMVWWAAGTWDQGHDAAGAITPWGAVLRLCESVIDGAECTHCHRPTMFEPELPIGPTLDELSQGQMCVYAWDPELSTFRRGCEGEPARPPKPKLWVPGA